MPLNEEGLDRTAVPASAVKVNDATTNVTSANLTYTQEGLAGYAKEFNGNNSKIEYGTGSADPTATCTTEMSIITHFVADNASDTRTIISQSGKFTISLNGSNQVVATATNSDATLTLTSGAIVAADGLTPTVVILTLDSFATSGNLKLYINGKLEDQSGRALSTGTTTRWKENAALVSNNNKFTVGAGSDSFDGKIEEIVVYPYLIYPVDIKSGEYLLDRPIKEFSSTGARLSNQAVLFVKDYHNIRGTRRVEVTRSPAITLSKSGLALYGG